MKGRSVWLVAGVLIIVGCVVVGLSMLRTDNPARVADARDQAGATGDPDSAGTSRQSAAAEAGREDEAQHGYEHFAAQNATPKPPSLAGTQVDGGVQADAQGRLVLDVGIRQMFEYFLSTTGEASLPEIKTWIAHYLDANLPKAAAQQAWGLFERYLSYRRQLVSVAEPGPGADVADLKAAIRQRNELREAVLGRDVADVFYGSEQAYDRFMLERREIEDNDALSAAQKRQRVAQARQNLPEDVRRVTQQATRSARAMESVADMRERGASEAEIHAWRESNLGTGATRRLEDLETRERQWNARYQAYRDARAQLDATEGLAPADKAQALRRLREKHFSQSQMKRVRALDRIRANGAEQASSESSP